MRRLVAIMLLLPACESKPQPQPSALPEGRPQPPKIRVRMGLFGGGIIEICSPEPLRSCVVTVGSKDQTAFQFDFRDFAATDACGDPHFQKADSKNDFLHLGEAKEIKSSTPKGDVILECENASEHIHMDQNWQRLEGSSKTTP